MQDFFYHQPVLIGYTVGMQQFLFNVGLWPESYGPLNSLSSVFHVSLPKRACKARQ